MKFSLGKNGFLFGLFFVTTVVLFEVHVVSSSDQTIILLSYDGFRYDYLDKYKEALPTLRKIASDGVRADYVQNVYPTETFPNHYTLVTGLYPESHGIVANNMYDPVFNASFTMKTNDSRWWQAGEPIWVTSEKVGHKTGVCYWPGYDAVIRGYQPSYRPMNTRKKRMPWRERVDTIAGWLSMTNPPVFISAHFGEPDRTGHEHGTDSLQMEKVLNKVDNITWYLMERLRQLSIFDRINVIFTSDHGMINYQSKNILDIDKYVEPELYTFWSPGITMFLVSNSSKSTLEDLYQQFKKVEREKGSIKFYKKDDIPESYHYRRNRRIADILGVLNPGVILKTGATLLANHTYGIHGYDASLPKMHPYFIAYGPAFKHGYKSGPIEMVDLYPLMCHILGIEPAPNNGSLARIQHLLLSNHWFTDNTVVVVVTSCTITTLACFIALYIFLKRRQSRDWNNDKARVGFKKRSTDSYKLLTESDEEDKVVFM